MPTPDRNDFCFGTIGAMRMIPSPLREMENSPTGWSNSGTFLGGGGYANESWDSHKNYVMEWRSSSSPRVAQLMQSYADGTYGRGLIYFIDPATYHFNVLPSRWADPSMALDGASVSLVSGVTPTSAATPSPARFDLPPKSAVYDLATAPTGYPGDGNSLFIPIPKDHYIIMGAVYTSTGTTDPGVYYQAVNAAGARAGTATRMTPISPTGLYMVNTTVPYHDTDAVGVRIWVGKSAAGAGTVTLSALAARVVAISTPVDKIIAIMTAPWTGGMGHSGCRFVGKPTRTTVTSAYGGQMAFAATFQEVGDWYYG